MRAFIRRTTLVFVGGLILLAPTASVVKAQYSIVTNGLNTYAGTKALTEGAATQFVQVGVPQTASSNYAGGMVYITVYETDGTDSTVLSGEGRWSCVNKAGTENCAAINASLGGGAQTGSATLSCTLSHVTGLTDTIAIAVNCTDSGTMTQTLLQVEWILQMPHNNSVVAQ